MDSTSTSAAEQEAFPSQEHKDSKGPGEENEGYLELAGEEDFEIDEGDSASLGRGQPQEPALDAEANQKFGAVRLRKSSASVMIGQLSWGIFQGKAAYRFTLDFSIRSATRFDLKSSTITCTITPLEQHDPNVSASQSQRPASRILEYTPRPRDNNKTVKRDPDVLNLDQLELAPEVSLPIGVTCKIGTIPRHRTYSPITGLRIRCRYRL